MALKIRDFTFYMVGNTIWSSTVSPIRDCVRNNTTLFIPPDLGFNVRSHVWNSVGVSVRAPVENSVRDIFDQTL